MTKLHGSLLATALFGLGLWLTGCGAQPLATSAPAETPSAPASSEGETQDHDGHDHEGHDHEGAHKGHEHEGEGPQGHDQGPSETQ